MPDHSSTVIE